MVITGFATGLAPIVGYSFGAGNSDYIKRVMKIALISAFIAGLVCWIIVLFSSAKIAELFSPENETVMALASSGFGIFAAAFLLNGFNILVTAYFTSIGNAKISAIIASMRGLLLINIFILILPRLVGDAGIWASYPLAELVTFLFAARFLRKSVRAFPPTSP